MTNLTKNEPAPEPVNTLHGPGICEDCGYRHPQVGTRRWWWEMRVSNLLLWLAPLLPLGFAVSEMVRPQARAAAPHGLPERMGSVVVDLDAAWWERPLVALPTLALAACFAVMSYAMWRVEVNLAGNHRPFTDKDMQWMRRAMHWEMYFFIVAAAGTAFLPMVLPSMNGLKDATMAPVMTDSFIILSMGVLFGQVLRLYGLARRFYDRQKDIV